MLASQHEAGAAVRSEIAASMGPGRRRRLNDRGKQAAQAHDEMGTNRTISHDEKEPDGNQALVQGQWGKIGHLPQ